MTSLVSPPIATQAGRTVLQAWLKLNVESGFDFVRAEWSGDGTSWRLLDTYTGQNAGYPGWSLITLGFDSPGGDIRVRFRFTSDLIISPLLEPTLTGARVDQVVVGRQAP